jgi:two-component system NtrC family response regulator
MSHIGIVEGHPETADFVARLLAEKGHTPVQFTDATQALDAIEGGGATLDLLIVSWNLPGMSGFQLMKTLRESKKEVRCIVIAPVITLATADLALGLGAKDIIKKPIDGNRLIAAVGMALEDPREANPLVAELRKELIGESEPFVYAIVRLAQAIHNPDINVLFVGETGVGKDLFARLIHYKGSRQHFNYVAINIAAPAFTLYETELFGHEKGAFTGAGRQRQGAFEIAGEGTLFLDEIGHLDITLQPKLLRVIEDRKFYRVGGEVVQPFNARLVCATSRNLATAPLREFLPELYYRICAFEIRIPPLRERAGDIPLLATHFLKGTGLYLENEALDILESYSFPGNVRELQSILAQARTVCTGKSILPAHLPRKVMKEREGASAIPASPQAIGQSTEVASGEYRWPESLFVRKCMDAEEEVLKQFYQVYLPRRIREASNVRKRAAERMGITERSLRDKLKRWLGSDAVREEKDDDE